MTWVISVGIAIGIILALFFSMALYIGIANGEKWAEITGLVLFLGSVFVVFVKVIHDIVFG